MKKVTILWLVTILLVGLLGFGCRTRTGGEDKSAPETAEFFLLSKEISPLSQPQEYKEETKALQEQEEKAAEEQKKEEVVEQEKEEEAAPLEVTSPTKVTLPSKPQAAVTPLPVKTPLVTPLVTPEKIELIVDPEVPAILSEAEEKFLNVQKKIGLTRKKNELGHLELEALRLMLEQQKVKDEITGLPVAGAPFPEPEPKIKPEKLAELPLAIPPSPRPQSADLSVLMYSSCKEGARALIRDGRKTFYVRVGSEIPRGNVVAITPQGIGVQEETKVEFYPISIP